MNKDFHTIISWIFSVKHSRSSHLGFHSVFSVIFTVLILSRNVLLSTVLFIMTVYDGQI